MPFRPEDEALLARLEEEALYARLFRAHAGPGAPEAPRRAAGLLHDLRAVPGAPEALATAGLPAAPGGEPSEVPIEALDRLTSLMAAPSFAGYSPSLLHHLGLHFARVAGCRERALARRGSGEGGAEAPDERRRELGPVEAWELALSAFFALSRCTEYLTDLVARALGPATGGAIKTRAADVARLAAELPFQHVARLVELGGVHSSELAKVTLPNLRKA